MFCKKTVFALSVFAFASALAAPGKAQTLTPLVKQTGAASFDSTQGVASPHFLSVNISGSALTINGLTQASGVVNISGTLSGNYFLNVTAYVDSTYTDAKGNPLSNITTSSTTNALTGAVTLQSNLKSAPFYFYYKDFDPKTNSIKPFKALATLNATVKRSATNPNDKGTIFFVILDANGRQLNGTTAGGRLIDVPLAIGGTTIAQ